MRLSEAEAVLRPRSPWEAMDLGLLLAARHRRLLMLSWACVTLPVLALASWLLWDHPTAVLLLLWWLKPAFERVPLDILAQAWTGAPPTLAQALRRFPGLLRSQLWPALIWRRLSLSRSFYLPISQLEGLDGPARQRRMILLRKDNRGAARWLTLVWANLECVFALGLMALVLMFEPHLFDQSWHLGTSLTSTASLKAAWPAHLTNLSYALVLTISEPMYVACGFGLYVNRRTQLEAWDIEQVLRRLAQRLGTVVGALLLAVALSLPGERAWAVAAPDSPRLLNQKVTSDAARQSVRELLLQPPFRNVETEEHWRWVRGTQPQTAPTAIPSIPSGRFEGMARVIEWLLWMVVMGGALGLAWRYRGTLAALIGRPPARTTDIAPLPMVAGVVLHADSLPRNLADTAEQLWGEHPREALSLLYRGLLSRLISDHRLALGAADTETQVLARVNTLGQRSLSQFSEQLTGHWLNLAYGHRLPPAEAREQLCQGWRALFEKPFAPQPDGTAT
ncbi:DUF4129 domain-containing protein [Pseudomonas sp. dw_358]|uniref:DUF4129 domain-containing protein n=1 Tax=Pseudomonas sp. dw_358 TaxID=2720083 RepID=UPI001BD4F13A|nr:DUF4129 domain-containing protein [Pseudomonas sp. dw_358]